MSSGSASADWTETAASRASATNIEDAKRTPAFIATPPKRLDPPQRSIARARLTGTRPARGTAARHQDEQQIGRCRDPDGARDRAARAPTVSTPQTHSPADQVERQLSGRLDRDGSVDLLDLDRESSGTTRPIDSDLSMLAGVGLKAALFL